MALIRANTSGGGSIAEDVVSVTNTGPKRTLTVTKPFRAITSLTNIGDAERQPQMSKIENNVISYYLVNISTDGLVGGTYTQQIKVVGII